MIFGKVAGTVISTEKADKLIGARYRLVEKCDQKGTGLNDFLVALDMVNSSDNDVVLVAQGSSCSWTDVTKDKAVDAIIVGIVDLIDEKGKLTYKR
ncbi:MAG: EutN/CcmL family microcompartment protein [Spirochaetaceae bacterium]|jgi:microcompartment protein CcmK/EutM|nr:EutN/CcmL family microcompartment protein [Spirochaetaceae bacterium]